MYTSVAARGQMSRWTLKNANVWCREHLDPNVVIEKKTYSSIGVKRENGRNVNFTRTHTQYEASKVVNGERVKYLGSRDKLWSLMRDMASQGKYLLERNW